MRVMSPLFGLALALSFAALLSACSGLRVERTPLAQPLDAPRDGQPAPIGFREIRWAVPTGTPVASSSPQGILGLFLCDWPYGMVEKGFSSRSFPDDNFKRLFMDTLEGQGYDVTGDPGRFFDEEEDEMRTTYAVGGRVVDVKADTCHRTNFWGIDRGVKGETSLTVEWSVFDLLTRRAVYKTQTKGYARLQRSNYDGVALMVEEAFSAAVNNLGAEPAFHDLVFYGTVPDDAPNTVEDPDEAPATLFDPNEDVTLDSMAVSAQTAEGRLEDLRRAVVMIEAGGAHGSGFFVTKQGHILTDAHVVGNAVRVRVVSSGKKEKMIGEVLRLDRRRDVALIRLEKVPDDLSIVTLPVRPREPAVGEPVYAIGAPMLRKLQDTVTKGIVSALRYDRRRRLPFIQADVDIYPGSSGGPLLDENGNAIGLAVEGYFIADETLGGLNWFIPVGDALKALEISHAPDAGPPAAAPPAPVDIRPR